MKQQFSVHEGRIAHSPIGAIPVDVYILPTREEQEYLIEKMGIDDHTLASAMDPNETPRIEFEDDYTVIIIKYPKNYSADDHFLFRVTSMGIFLFPDRVIIVHDDDIPLFTNRTVKVFGTQDVLLRTLAQIVRHFQSHLRAITMCSEEIESQMDEKNDSESLMDMFILEKSLVYYVNALNGNKSILERMRVNAYRFKFSDENLELLEDLQIENHQYLTQAQVDSQVLTNLVSTRSNMIDNNLNQLMKNMNAIVIAISVPTFFTGVFGMSEFTMMSGKIPWYVSFPIFFFIMIFIGIGVYWLVQKFEKH